MKAVYPSRVYLNGDILDASEASVSVFDRGFLFGDGIYEVMARINGRFFYEEAHMDRLQWCLEQIQVEADISALQAAIPELLKASDLLEKDCLLYMQVSRGVAPRQHSFPKEISPTLMMYAWEKRLPDINEELASVVTMADYRWSRCDIKSTSLLGNVMANEYAMNNDCYESLFIRDGLITEASHCNVFFVREGIVFTHPTGPYILDGVTRQVVLELCQKMGLEVRQEGIPADQVHNMDEAFLTGTSTQIMAISEIDGKPFQQSAPGLVTRQIQEAFLKCKTRG